MPRPCAAVGDVDQLQAAAAEVADDAVRLGDAGEHAFAGQPRLFLRAQDSQLEADPSTSRRKSAPSAASRTAAVATTCVRFTFM